MNNSLETSLAIRFLLGRRREKFVSLAVVIAIIGLALGVGALIVSLSVVSGFQKEIKKSILGFNSHLVLMKGDEIKDPQGLVEKITQRYSSARRGTIRGWTPFIYREGMVVSGSSVRGIVLKGVDFENYRRLSGITLQERKPDPRLRGDDTPEIILGKVLASEIRDSTLRVFFPQDKKVRRFRVRGTFESGVYEYDSSFAMLPIETAQEIFQTKGRVSGVEFWLDDPDRAEEWAAALRADFDYPYVLLTWRELNENLFRALEVEKILFGILMGVMVVVASLNILCSLIMLLLEKRSEVAILRAAGFSWRRVRKIFLLDGLLIGCAGVFLGLALGASLLFFLEKWRPIELAPEIYFVDHLPVAFSWLEGLGVAAGALIVVWIGCVISLKRVSQIPVTRVLLEGK